MNTQPEALRLAQWLESSNNPHDRCSAVELRRLHEENTALRQAIEQHEKQEVINKQPTKICGPNLEEILNSAGFYRIPPRKEWVGLTGEELAQITIDNAGYPTQLTVAIEAKLKEKNT